MDKRQINLKRIWSLQSRDLQEQHEKSRIGSDFGSDGNEYYIENRSDKLD